MLVGLKSWKRINADFYESKKLRLGITSLNKIYGSSEYQDNAIQHPPIVNLLYAIE